MDFWNPSKCIFDIKCRVKWSRKCILLHAQNFFRKIYFCNKSASDDFVDLIIFTDLFHREVSVEMLILNESSKHVFRRKMPLFTFLSLFLWRIRIHKNKISKNTSKLGVSYTSSFFIFSSLGMPAFDWREPKTSVKTSTENVIAALRLAAIRVLEQRRECRASNQNWDASLAIKTGMDGIRYQLDSFLIFPIIPRWKIAGKCTGQLWRRSADTSRNATQTLSFCRGASVKTRWSGQRA